MKKLFTVLALATYLFSSVDINHANLKELSTLKGIGEAKAKSITLYIKNNGCFKDISELKKVKGIGQSFIKKNEKNITILPCKKKD